MTDKMLGSIKPCNKRPILREESSSNKLSDKLNCVGTYDTHSISSELKINEGGEAEDNGLLRMKDDMSRNDVPVIDAINVLGYRNDMPRSGKIACSKRQTHFEKLSPFEAEKEAIGSMYDETKAEESKLGKYGNRGILGTMECRYKGLLTGGESCSKRRKLFDKMSYFDKHVCRSGAEGVDIFSNLMECVIGQILSFLPTKDALRTCVLSSEWEKHWMLVEKLEFDYHPPFKTPRTGYTREDYRRNSDYEDIFIRCLDRVIRMTNKSGLRLFSLAFDPPFHTKDPVDWILGAVDSVLSRGICELNICTRLPGYKMGTRLPSSVLLCSTLEVLKLGSEYLLEVPPSFCLPRLKILSLHDIRFCDHQSLSRLISGCPELEDLSLACHWKEVLVMHISALALKTVNLELFLNKSVEVVLDTPRLASLSIVGIISLSSPFSMKHPHTLVRANLQPIFVELQDWISFLSGIKYVQSFSLIGVPSEFEGCQWPDFPNMTTLCTGSNPAWKLLMCLMNKAPRLETVVFENSLPNRMGSTYVKSPPCLSLRLKVIIIRNLSCECLKRVNMINYLLAKGKALEKLEIHIIGREPQLIKKALLNKLQISRKASRRCQIVIS